MGLISIDLISVSEQIERMEVLRRNVGELLLRTDEMIRSAACTGLHEAEDAVRTVRHRLLDGADELDSNINKLRRIIDLYNDCERELERIADDLPLAIPNNDIKVSAACRVVDEKDLPDSMRYSFGSHSVINDDWLNELIY